ncbi:hypothetical protein ACFSQD_19020 [Flavihumibacter stibioxidans]|uniref:Uncharacterized protein n=1 Tax=Flavihumibacter stibioxidans TaxID=1834163 RepID=A0ABR7MBR8_9BACT|nr:hypothetical protein [Flavihumibacter stibioxidans]MBC6492492.1 hypothetical protein [Flavihumibacter stibioxidans]
MNPTGKKWCRIALFNLLLVAIAGVLLRLKILVALPWLHHKNLLHGHSHFAFAGWVSLFLMGALVGLLPERLSAKYGRILLAYAVSAYGMLISFPFQGYGAVSIFFSTLSVLFSWWFAVVLWKDLAGAGLATLVSNAIRWSLVFLVISAAGTFFLAWLMATHVNNARLYFAAIYFYLHFQYNGWFFFAILALFFSQLPLILQERLRQPVLWLAMAAIPAYFLSALWMSLPSWMYIAAVLAALAQTAAFIILLKNLLPYVRNFFTGKSLRTVWLLSLMALCIKFLLQGLSVFPALSKYAFAYRPVVIGYLHLVLLGFVSFFLFGWLIRHDYIPAAAKKLPASVWLFIIGFVLTEGTLMAQGITSMFFVAIPHTNEMLLVAALFLLAGIAWMNRQTTYSPRPL